MIRAIRETAMGEVFAEDLESLDADARVVVNRIVAYLEKKYVGLPMKLAKEAVLEQLRKS
jgi:glutamyl-tRNA reductase